MADHKHEHGTMNIEVQEKTFETFVRAVAYSIVGIVVFLLFLYGVNG